MRSTTSFFYIITNIWPRVQVLFFFRNTLKIYKCVFTSARTTQRACAFIQIVFSIYVSDGMNRHIGTMQVFLTICFCFHWARARIRHQATAQRAVIFSIRIFFHTFFFYPFTSDKRIYPSWCDDHITYTRAYTFKNQMFA